jgi:nitroreductase
VSRKRKGALEPIGGVIARDRELRVPGAQGGSPVSPRDWEAAVGSRIAARAQPVLLERGVLLVRAATSTWAQELTLLADAIVEQLRGRGLSVRLLRFRVGPVEAPERQAAREPPRREPPLVPLPLVVREELARVGDAELREAIARAAGKNLGWQAMNATARAPTAGRRAARDPRSAEAGTDRPDRTTPPASGARRGTP